MTETSLYLVFIHLKDFARGLSETPLYQGTNYQNINTDYKVVNIRKQGVLKEVITIKGALLQDRTNYIVTVLKSDISDVKTVIKSNNYDEIINALKDLFNEYIPLGYPSGDIIFD